MSFFSVGSQCRYETKICGFLRVMTLVVVGLICLYALLLMTWILRESDGAALKYRVHVI